MRKRKYDLLDIFMVVMTCLVVSTLLILVALD